MQFPRVRVLPAHSRVFPQSPHSWRVGDLEVHKLRSCHNALKFGGYVGKGCGIGYLWVWLQSGSIFLGRIGLEECHCHRLGQKHIHSYWTCSRSVWGITRWSGGCSLTPRFATARHAFSLCCPYQSMTLTSSMMDPFSFRVLSTLWTGTGFGKGWVSSLCFWTKAQLTNIPVAPELRRVDVETDCRVVVQSSMTMLRAQAV